MDFAWTNSINKTKWSHMECFVLRPLAGLPHLWSPMQRTAMLQQLTSAFSHLQYRPLPIVPEGWCGPLAIAILYFWLGLTALEPLEHANRLKNNKGSCTSDDRETKCRVSLSGCEDKAAGEDQLCLYGALIAPLFPAVASAYRKTQNQRTGYRSGHAAPWLLGL